MTNLPTTGNAKLDTALMALPDHYRIMLPVWLGGMEERVTNTTDNMLKMTIQTVNELQLILEAKTWEVLGLRDSEYDRGSHIIIFAKLQWARNVLDRMKFYRALMSPNFAYVTSGSPQLPDVYGIYHSHPTSPTGVLREIGGDMRDPRYAELIRLAGRQTCGSRAGGY